MLYLGRWEDEGKPMINLFKVHMPDAVDEPLLAVLHSGYITQGSKVEEFEQAFGKLVGDPKVVTVNSGTSALTLALRLAGVKAGDEVITTPMTCSATNLPILSLSATPVFADIDPLTGLIRPGDIEGRITPHTKAIMAVDWGGMPVDVAALQDIADRWHLKLIVDAAHAMGTVHNAQADFFCFSLQAIKHITTVDGGLLICKDEADYERAKRLRWFGINRNAKSLDSRIDEDIEEWGYKFHMNDVAATIGIVQLQFVHDVVRKHLDNASFYNEYLSRFYRRPHIETNSAYWLYTVVLPSKEARDSFKRYMTSNGIQVSQVHRRNDEYSVFKPFANLSSPGLEEFSDRMICIPVNWSLNDSQRDFILEVCNTFAEGWYRASAELGEEL